MLQMPLLVVSKSLVGACDSVRASEGARWRVSKPTLLCSETKAQTHATHLSAFASVEVSTSDGAALRRGVAADTLLTAPARRSGLRVVVKGDGRTSV